MKKFTLLLSLFSLSVMAQSQFGWLTPEQRDAYINKAHVWLSEDISKKDLLNGPAIKGSIPFNSRDLTCAYVERQMSGSTPKFSCQITPTDIVKVKYLPDSGEVHSEILGTRIFWALGFPADNMYPVKLTCIGCPNPPSYGGAPVPNSSTTYVAAIERKFKGEELETFRDSGWDYAELEKVDVKLGGSNLAERDALRLLTAFVQHWDNKDDNQRLVCPKDMITKKANGPQGCKKPVLMVQDLGEVMGSVQDQARADYNYWKSTPVWKDKSTCIAQLDEWYDSHFSNPKISEAGRAFLSSLLKQLTDKQLQDLFTAALLEMKGHSTTEWVQLWKEKVKQITDHHCPN